MKKIVLGLLFMMSFSFATTEGAKGLVNFLGFTGVSVSLDLAALVSVLIALITWKLTKDKERNELKEKEKLEAKKEVLEYLEKLRDNTKKLIDFKNHYDNVIKFKIHYDSVPDEEKKKLQLQNAPLISNFKIEEKPQSEIEEKLQLQNTHLISEYQENLNKFLFISPIYSKKLYEILKDSMDDFKFAQKNGSIEIVVFNSIKTMGKLLIEYTEEEVANDLIKFLYGVTIEEDEKKLQEEKSKIEKKIKEEEKKLQEKESEIEKK